MVSAATDPVLPSEVKAYVTVALSPVGVAVTVKRTVVLLGLPSTTALGTVVVPSAPVMTSGNVHPVICPSVIQPL